MEIEGKVAATIEMSWDPKPRNLGGRQVLSSGVESSPPSAVRTLVLTLLRKLDAKATDFESTLHSWVSTLLRRRRASLHASTRGFPSCGAGAHCAPVLAASPQPSTC